MATDINSAIYQFMLGSGTGTPGAVKDYWYDPNLLAWVPAQGGAGGSGKTPASKTGSASATFTLVPAVPTKRIKVYGLTLTLVSATAVTVTFKDGAGGTALATYLLQTPTNVMGGVSC